MPKKLKTPKAKDTKTESSEHSEKDVNQKVIVQLSPDAPFDVLKHGEYKVGKEQPAEVTADIANHRHARYLITA